MSDMERLTIDEVIEHCKRNVKMKEKYAGRDYFEVTDRNTNFEKEYWEHRQVAEWLNELQRYRDLAEQGRLVELPCKVGDTVYALTPFCEICEADCDDVFTCKNCSKGNFISDTKFDYEMIPMVGKVVFLTKAEAEAKLKELEGGV